MITRVSLRRLACVCFATVATLAAHTAIAGKPVKLVIEAPETVKPGGWLFTEGWPVTFSMEVENAAAFVAKNISSFQFDVGAEQALVIDDPDGCLDVRSFEIGGFPYEIGCPGEDERYFPFRFDPTDWARLPDGVCRPSADVPPYLLVDDEFGSKPVQDLNTAYINEAGTISPTVVGPDSGGSRDTSKSIFDDNAFDCYGFGADIDGVVGLVVWADIGPFKVMDEDLNGTGPSGAVSRLRNGAGFVTSITSVLLDSHNRSNVKATIAVPRGLFEPIIAIDSDLDPMGPYSSFDYIRQIDNGPIEGFNYEGGGSPGNVARARIISADLPPIRVTLKAVLVEGVAPDFINDVNLDGKFNAADLVADGYTLLSNVARYRIRARRAYNLEFGGDRCPPNNMLVAKDLDGADLVGIPQQYFCSTGSARSGRRVPR